MFPIGAFLIGVGTITALAAVLALVMAVADATIGNFGQVKISINGAPWRVISRSTTRSSSFPWRSICRIFSRDESSVLSFDSDLISVRIAFGAGKSRSSSLSSA